MDLDELKDVLTKTNRQRGFDKMVEDCGFIAAFDTLPNTLHLTDRSGDYVSGRESSICGLPWYMLKGSTTDFLTFMHECVSPRFHDGVCQECLREVRMSVEDCDE